MRRTSRITLAATVVAVAATVAACGSAVPPEQVIAPGGRQFGVAPGNAAGNTGAVACCAASAGPAGSTTGAAAAAGSGTGGAGRPSGAGGSSAVGVGGGAAGRSGNGSGGVAGAPNAASCAGFTNGPGITDSTITIANASDVSGPVPGLFKAAQQATQAFTAYFNSTSSICGRKLRVETIDSATSTTGDQQAATTACGNAFALVGSVSAFDSGGAATVAKCGIPDLRAVGVTPERATSPVSFGADAITISQVPAAPFSYVKSISGDAYQHAAIMYLTAGSAATNAQSFKKAAESLGFRFAYTQAIDVTTFNYAPYVSAMQSKGVKFVQYTGAYQNAIRLKQAMDQQGFHPVFFMDSVAYDPMFVSTGGKAVNGTYAFIDTAMFEDQARNPEMQLYLKWLNLVAPGAAPSFFGMFAWGATRLFTQLASQLGGTLTRASLLAAIKATRDYTSNGLFAPQAVGSKATSRCQTVIQLVDGKWIRKTSYPYACAGIVHTGVG